MRDPSGKGAGSIETLAYSWSEAVCSGRRCITQKAGNAVEDVPARKESAEDLIVQRVQPFAAEFNVVIARDDREVVFDVRAPEQFVDVRFEEERITEPESRHKPHRRVCRDI